MGIRNNPYAMYHILLFPFLCSVFSQYTTRMMESIRVEATFPGGRFKFIIEDRRRKMLTFEALWRRAEKDFSFAHCNGRIKKEAERKGIIWQDHEERVCALQLYRTFMGISLPWRQFCVI